MVDRPYYRFYCVSPRGRFVGVEDAHCETDADAKAHARAHLEAKAHCVAIEVWQRDRLVCQVRRDQAA